jgi:citrate lyase subunit beta/citryl-CoA lyase
VPGDQPDMLAKATRRGADAVIVDLEDAVAPAAKTYARDTVGSWLSRQGESPTALWVRVNPQPDLLERDLAAVVHPVLRGVYLPKVSSTDEVEFVADRLDALEAAARIEPGRLRIAPLLETAAGILAAPRIAASTRVSHMSIGEADLVAELGMHPSPGRPELNPIRTALVVASAAAGLNPPIGPVETAFRDLDSLRTTSEALRRMGYGGRAAVHPDQIPIINAVFSPTVDELASARDIVDRFEAARREGGAVTVAEDGSLIDEAVVRLARITVASQNPPTTER